MALPLAPCSAVSQQVQSGSEIDTDDHYNQYRFLQITGAQHMSARTLLDRQIAVLTHHGWRPFITKGSISSIENKLIREPLYFANFESRDHRLLVEVTMIRVGNRSGLIEPLAVGPIRASIRDLRPVLKATLTYHPADLGSPDTGDNGEL